MVRRKVTRASVSVSILAGLRFYAGATQFYAGSTQERDRRNVLLLSAAGRRSKHLPVDGINEMNTGTGEARDAFISRACGSGRFLGKQCLNLVAGPGTIEQDRTPALTVSHVFTPSCDSRQLSIR